MQTLSLDKVKNLERKWNLAKL